MTPRDNQSSVLELERTWAKARLKARLRNHPPPVQRIGRYSIGQLVGRGGMGAVYRADDERMGRTVAIKLVPIGSEPHAVEKFLAEARAIAAVSHPNIVAIFDVGIVASTGYIVMEFVDGTSLRDWWAAADRSIDDIIDVFAAAAQGLHAAHVAGIVHRDFKPENVIVRADGVPKVADFGLAIVHDRAFEARAGTPGYVAPEQREGHPSAASDQYSFCVALSQALPLAATRALRRVVTRGTAPDPRRRYPSMAEVATLLLRARTVRPRPLLLRVALAAFVVAIAWVSLARPDERQPTIVATDGSVPFEQRDLVVLRFLLRQQAMAATGDRHALAFVLLEAARILAVFTVPGDLPGGIHLADGWMLWQLGRHAECRDATLRAVASANGSPQMRFKASLLAIDCASKAGAVPTEIERLDRTARAELEALGNRADLRASYVYHRGLAHYEAHEYLAAIESFAAAEPVESNRGRRMDMGLVLAHSYAVLGRFEEAEAAALRASKAALVAPVDRIGLAKSNAVLAGIYSDTERWDQARAHFEAAVAPVAESSHGSQLELLAVLLNYGDFEWERDEHQRAFELYRRARAIADELLSPGDPVHTLAQMTMVKELSHRQEHERALELARELLRRCEVHRGPLHLETIRARRAVAIALTGLGDHPAALLYYAEAHAHGETWAAAQGMAGHRRPDFLALLKLDYADAAVRAGESTLASRLYRELSADHPGSTAHEEVARRARTALAASGRKPTGPG